MPKLLLALAILWPAGSCVGQVISRHEVAIGASSTSDRPDGDIPEASAGTYRIELLAPQLRYTFNLNRNAAIETEASQSINLVAINVREGGHQLLALAGLKAGIRRGRFGLFGTSSAGVAGFSRGEGRFNADGSLTYQRVTHFALQQGVAVEFATSPRAFLRFDAAELLDAQFRRDYIRTAEFAYTSFAAVPYHFATSISVGRRFGSLGPETAPEEDRKDRGYSIGGVYVTGIREHLLETDVRADGGGGAWIGFPLWKCISGDALAFDQPHDDHTADYQDGGTAFSAFLGPKIGFRKGPVGLYAKGRPGIIRFSRTDVFDVSNYSGLFLHDHAKIDFALDTGLVLEYTPLARGLSHTVARFEGGSEYIHYHGTFASYQDTPVGGPTRFDSFYIAPQRHSALLFLAGFGFRF